MRKTPFPIVVCIHIFVIIQLACVLTPSPATEIPPIQPAEMVIAQTTQDAAGVHEEGCPVLQAAQTSPSGLVSDITMSRNVEEETMAPVEPTSSYGRQDIFHAVVHIENAPANSRIRVAWYATDVGEAAPCNSRIDAHEITADGTRYIDFNLTPDTPWPSGTYRAEVFFNDNLERVLDFSVQ